MKNKHGHVLISVCRLPVVVNVILKLSNNNILNIEHFLKL